MKKLRRISALLMAVMLTVVFWGNVHALGVEQVQLPYTEDTKLLADDPAQEEEGDIDVPFEPAKVVKSIRIDTLPAKLEYLQGEELDVSGMVVKATYSNYSTATVTEYEITDYSPDVLGEQTVTVSFGGKTTTFQVTVFAVGDANGDKEVNGNDATLLLQYAAGWNVDINEIAADANGDGEVNGNDATLLLQYAAGWNVTLG